MPYNWKWCRLGDICQVVGGGTPKSEVSEYWTDSGIHWITPADLGNYRGKYISKGRRDITDIGLKESSAILMPKGTVLFSSRAPIGHIAIADNEISTNQGFKSIVPFIMSMNLYIYYFMKWDTPRINENAPGTTFKEVSEKIISNNLISIPPLAEQQRIVAKVESLMSEIDKFEESLQNKEHIMKLLPKAVVDAISICQNGKELKEQLQFIIENFETIFQAPNSMQELRNVVLQLAIEGKLVPQDKNDEPASELIKKIKIKKDKLVKEGKIKNDKLLPKIEDDEITFVIPESWEWVRLGDIGDTQTGTTPKTSVAEYFHGNVPFIKPADISSKGINYDNESLTQFGLKAGRLIGKNSNMMVCIGGSIGKTYYTNRDCSCNQQINTLTSYSDVDYIYTHSVFTSPYFYNQIWSKSSGTATPIINKSTWDSILIPLPPIQEQHRIVKKVESIMNLIDNMENKLKQKYKLVEKMANQ